MNFRAVGSICGLLLLILAGTLLAPLLVAYLYDETPELISIGSAIAFSVVAGAALFWGMRKNKGDLGSREGFAIVALGWIVLSLVGALPFWLTPNGLPNFIDAFFETMSGFTTTGASVVTDIEGLPKSLLFWRSLTHWLGGMGIVVLTVAILPFLGAGGYQMLRAEVPGPTADKLKPRIAQTATILWTVYFLLTAIETVLLWFAPEMDFFEAICHAFGTLATGGFSTRNSSVAAYDSLYVDVVITVFMFLAGANFVLHYYVLRGKGIPHFRDSEFRAYTVLFVGATLFFAVLMQAADMDQGKYGSFGDCIRYSAFQVAALLSTTGFATDDYEVWPNACRVVIVLLMVSGGCAGSTGGGVKVIRLLVLAKYGVREIQRLVRPHAVLPVKIGGHAIERETVERVMGFVALYLVIFFFSTLAMMMILDAGPLGSADSNYSAATAFGSVLATIGNIGPGFAGVGPTENFAAIPDIGKALLSFLMLVGRLEIYSVLVILIPLTWRR